MHEDAQTTHNVCCLIDKTFNARFRSYRVILNKSPIRVYKRQAPEITKHYMFVEHSDDITRYNYEPPNCRTTNRRFVIIYSGTAHQFGEFSADRKFLNINFDFLFQAIFSGLTQLNGFRPIIQGREAVIPLCFPNGFPYARAPPGQCYNVGFPGSVDYRVVGPCLPPIVRGVMVPPCQGQFFTLATYN